MTEYEEFMRSRERAEKRLTAFITFSGALGVLTVLYGVLQWLGVL